MEYFRYSDKETDYLKSVDPRLALVIEKVGKLRMPLDPDMFTAIIRNIIGQQISIPVYERIWADCQRTFGNAPNPEDIIKARKSALLRLGLTVRKTEYILGIAEKFVDGSLAMLYIWEVGEGRVSFD